MNMYIWKNKKLWVIGIIFVLSISSCVYYFTKDVYDNQQSYKDHLIRFHVLANSDDPKDQELKLKVRDKIIEAMNPKFEKSQSLEESRRIIQKNIKEIETIAENEIQKNNQSYKVVASLGDYDFPTKNYGSITLPAGNYEALRVVIGKGEGQNWWCVMFPPLCFIDMKNGLTDKKTEKEMMNVLTKEEFNMIRTAKSEGEVPIKLKFKVVEMLEEAKTKLNRMAKK
ncbi:stage II sporulation protein R [Inediibacterium massiliense]|uniref:stage II sporulation protein R n=1 Tax=Inediibacterium massiliense TaxID=1658111 RepID=UPI000A5EA16E|nr:stage II sporulation protein R [Inediibacterium massiliense]